MSNGPCPFSVTLMPNPTVLYRSPWHVLLILHCYWHWIGSSGHYTTRNWRTVLGVMFSIEMLHATMTLLSQNGVCLLSPLGWRHSVCLHTEWHLLCSNRLAHSKPCVPLCLQVWHCVNEGGPYEGPGLRGAPQRALCWEGPAGDQRLCPPWQAPRRGILLFLAQERKL